MSSKKFSSILFSPLPAFLLAAMVSLFLHWTIFSKDLIGVHVWRQTQTQLNIYHYAVDDANIFHPKINQLEYPDGINRMEFPIFQWMIGMIERFAGYSVFLTRTLLFITGLVSVAGMMLLAKNLFTDTKAAALAGWTFTFSPLFFYYTLNPLPDLFAMCCAIWGLAFWFIYEKHRHTTQLLAATLFLTLATLSKLPYVVFFGVMLVPFIKTLQEKKGKELLTLLLSASFLILPILWYMKVIPEWRNNPVTHGLLDTSSYKMSDLLNLLFGNLVSSLPELFLNYGSVLFFIAGLYFALKNKLFRHQKFKQLATCGILVMAYFLFELQLIGTTHDYYMLPFLPLLFLLVTYGAITLLKLNFKWVKTMVIICLLVLPVTAAIRILPRWNEAEPGFNSDVMKYKEKIQQLLPANAPLITVGDESSQIWFYYFKRSGWCFPDGKLNEILLAEHIMNGAEYVVSDRPSFDELLLQQDHLIRMNGEFGTIRVYKIRH